MPGQLAAALLAGREGFSAAGFCSVVRFFTTLRFTKVAGIVVLTDELVRFSNPSAEAIVPPGSDRDLSPAL